MTNVSGLVKPDLSKPITRTQWDVVEQYYIDKINEIHIPEDPKPFDITAINSKLEKLYHEARLDFYYASRNFTNVEGAYRKLKRALYGIVKVGKNADERDHLLQEHLMLTTLDKIDAGIVSALGLQPLPVTIYTLFDSYKDRVDFIKTVLDLISDKTSRLITDSGAMKIDATLAPRG